jgi:phospholipid/cholesterol/gamma-HCH transport system ATP-binding protein
MKKRVGLARALAMDPQLLFLDEPTSGLDPASAASFDRLVQELKHMLSLTIVMVTHDLDSINSVIDRFVLLYKSKAVFIGTLEESKRANHYAIKKFFKTNQKR